MLNGEFVAPALSFARVPPEGPGRASHGSLALRRFGIHAEDLEVRFDLLGRPWLVTAILSRCLRRAAGSQLPETEIWGMTLSQRIGCLLAVAFKSRGMAFEVALRCKKEGCGEAFEIPFSLEELSEADSRAAADPASAGGRVRRPTGNDQLAWLGLRLSGEELRLAMAESLSNGEPWSTAEELLERIDPLLDFRVTSACPACGTEQEHPVDLEALALGRLRRDQEALLRSVHRLATRYHWTESEVFAVPPSRREVYLGMIEEETG